MNRRLTISRLTNRFTLAYGEFVGDLSGHRRARTSLYATGPHYRKFRRRPSRASGDPFPGDRPSRRARGRIRSLHLRASSTAGTSARRRLAPARDIRSEDGVPGKAWLRRGYRRTLRSHVRQDDPRAFHRAQHPRADRARRGVRRLRLPLRS